MPDVWTWFILLLTLLLLMASGMVSASETAFFSLTPGERNRIEQGESAAYRRIHSLLKDSERLPATLLIADNFINVAFIILGNHVLMQSLDYGVPAALTLFFNTLILAVLILLFGEIMPKTYAARHALPVCRTASPFLTFFRRLFRPVSGVLIRAHRTVNQVVVKENYNISVDELSQALELTDKNDISDEQSMLQGIIRFGGETAKEVMTPRPDIVGLDIQTPFPEVIRCIIDNAYSRIPIYQRSRDNIKGILYIKDLLPHLDKGNTFRWQSLIRPPYFVPETKMLDDLLREFQQNKVHMAIVVDEFGGTSGLVTMEDIIEEIVGEINDEYDEDERTYIKFNDSTYIFEGKTLLSDFYKIVGIDEDSFEDVVGEADTLAGLLLELKGEFPKRHEKLTYRNFTFEILEMDERRILKVKVTLSPLPGKDEETAHS